MAIIVVSPGKKPQRLDQQHVEREDYLQQYLQDNPETLPVEELKPGAKLLVISREFPTDSGPIDALAMDDDGDLYIVETKLAKNPDKRRVIAQMLDYGAALWNAGAESFLATAGGYESLNEKIAEAFATTEEDGAASIIRNVRANIDAGRFQFIVLMNQIDERLRTLITFVNSNSRFRILGLELDFYRHGDVDILIPRLFGAETRSLETMEPTGRGRKWTKEEFFEQVADNLSPGDAARVRELYEWAAKTGEIRWGTTADLASFNVAFPQVSTARLFKLHANGRLVLPLSRAGSIEAPFRSALRSAGFIIADEDKKPWLELDAWRDRLDAFIGAVTQIIR